MILTAYSCKKNSISNNNSNNNNNNTTITDTTKTDSFYAIIRLTPKLGISASYKSSIRFIWGDGIITNLAYQTSNQFSHTYSLYHDTFNLQINAKGLWEINFDGQLYSTDTLGIMQNPNFSNCPNIQKIIFTNKKTSTVDVINCTKLKLLDCRSNNISTLNLTTNPALEYLYCTSNLLTSLDLSKDTSLITLYCDNNLLTVLDLTYNNKVGFINCDGNQLTDFIITPSSKVRTILLNNNSLSATTLNNLFSSLPIVTAGTNGASIYIRNNPGTFSCNTLLANNRGWSVITN